MKKKKNLSKVLTENNMGKMGMKPMEGGARIDNETCATNRGDNKEDKDKGHTQTPSALIG
jgi:hypothetical protein